MSLLLHLTPLLILILLHRLCPAHFPPSMTTSKLFLLYTLSSQLLAHRPSPWSLIQNLALLVFAHILIAAIYVLHHLARFADWAKKALLPVYAHVAESVQLSVQNLAAHIAQLENPPQLEEPLQDQDQDQNNTLDTELDPAFEPQLQLADALPVDGIIVYTPPSEDIHQLLENSASPTPSFLHEAFLRLHELAQLIVLHTLHTCSLLLSQLGIVVHLYNQAAFTLHIRRIHFTLFMKSNLEPLYHIFSYLLGLGNLFSPAIAIFALHFTFWTVLLSIGALYALCIG
ncbi:hypothetical protein V8C42DRAFT_344704 [Trichoderma barbatum]